MDSNRIELNCDNVPCHVLLAHGYDSSPASLPAGMQHNTNPAFLLKRPVPVWIRWVVEAIPDDSELNINPAAKTTAGLN